MKILTLQKKHIGNNCPTETKNPETLETVTVDPVKDTDITDTHPDTEVGILALYNDQLQVRRTDTLGGWKGRLTAYLGRGIPQGIPAVGIIPQIDPCELLQNYSRIFISCLHSENILGKS